MRLCFFEIYMARDQQQTQVEFNKRGNMSIWKEYLRLVHDVLVLFMFFLMADLTGVGSTLCY